MDRHILTWCRLAACFWWLCFPRLSQVVVAAEAPVLKSIYHREYSLKDLERKDTKALVFFFMKVGCPAVRQYIPVVNALHRKYGPRGIHIYGVYSEPNDNVFRMATDAEAFDVAFPVLLDDEGRLRALVGAKRSSEAVLLGERGRILYQGAVDDQFYKDGARSSALTRYLQEAIESHLAGKPVKTTTAEPSGCFLARWRERSHSKATFYKDVLPILQRRCQKCHRPGEVGPVSLMSYEEASAFADTIAEAVRDRRMPPWHGLSPRAMSNDIRPTEAEIRTVLDWAATGAPEGDEKDAPSEVSFPNPATWRIGGGKPDFIYKMSSPFRIPATGSLPYQYFRIPLRFPEDRWVQAVETRPGARKAVHHIQVHEVPASDKSGGFSPLEQFLLYGFSLDNTRLVGSFEPGNESFNARTFGPDQGLRIRKGTDLVLELHYTPYGKEANDQSEIGLVFRKEKPLHEMKSYYPFGKRGHFEIKAHDNHVVMTDEYFFENDVKIYGLRPHMHARGKSFRIELVHAEDNRSELLVAVPAWSFDWQRTYELKEPVILKSGDYLRATGRWDNSWMNPKNPNPDENVYWGQQSNQEMFNTFIFYEDVTP